MKSLQKHFEWIAFLSGLIIMGTMNPNVTGTSFCLFELVGIEFCPGEGLGHSIAWFFRGEFTKAFNANLFGPVTVLILISRIILIWKEKLIPIILEKGQTDDTCI